MKRTLGPSDTHLTHRRAVQRALRVSRKRPSVTTRIVRSGKVTVVETLERGQNGEFYITDQGDLSRKRQRITSRRVEPAPRRLHPAPGSTNTSSWSR